jgi:hypothetical protein
MLLGAAGVPGLAVVENFQNKPIRIVVNVAPASASTSRPAGRRPAVGPLEGLGKS